VNERVVTKAKQKQKQKQKQSKSKKKNDVCSEIFSSLNTHTKSYTMHFLLATYAFLSQITTFRQPPY
jgi:hypothetical protein